MLKSRLRFHMCCKARKFPLSVKMLKNWMTRSRSSELAVCAVHFRKHLNRDVTFWNLMDREGNKTTGSHIINDYK